MIQDFDKIFFNPGDLVVVKHEELPYRPIMVVSRVVRYVTKDNEQGLAGIVCWWFSQTGEYSEVKFNTKDLVHYKR